LKLNSHIFHYHFCSRADVICKFGERVSVNLSRIVTSLHPHVVSYSAPFRPFPNPQPSFVLPDFLTLPNSSIPLPYLSLTPLLCCITLITVDDSIQSISETHFRNIDDDHSHPLNKSTETHSSLRSMRRNLSYKQPLCFLIEKHYGK